MSQSQSNLVNNLAEKGVLSNILLNPDDLILVQSIITPYDFYEPSHAKIYESITSLANEGRDYGLINLAGQLNENGELTQVGGIEYLIGLANPDAVYASTSDAIGHAMLVKEASQKRQLVSLGHRLVDEGRGESGTTAAEALSVAEEELRKISKLIVTSKTESPNDFIDEFLVAIKERENIPEGGVVGVPSGFIDLDKTTMGWKPGQMIIIAGRPGMGKSTIALDFLRAASLKAGFTSLFFSRNEQRRTPRKGHGR